MGEKGARRGIQAAAHSARLHLTGPVGLADQVRDLTARETGCCSFFVFITTAEPAAEGETVVLDVKVPYAYADVLASLVQRATVSVVAGGCRG